MTPLLQGLIAGAAFGAVTVAVMFRLPFPDKRAALLGAFADRFAIGRLIPLIQTSRRGWLVGAGVGLLLSLPGANITKAYVPIIVLGTAGGLLVGGFTRGFP
jgi:hypothetical protein